MAETNLQGNPESAPAGPSLRGVVLLAALAVGWAVALPEQARWLSTFWRGWTQADLGAPWRGGYGGAGESLRGLGWGLAVFATVTFGGYFLLTGLRCLRRVLPSLGERLLLAPLAGAVPFSLLILGNGLFGAIGVERPLKGIVMWLIFAAFGVGCLVRSGWRRRSAWPGCRGTSWGVWAVALALAALAVPYALSPSVESDELRYHLAAPATWLREGKIEYVPYQAFFNFPMLAEMLFLPALYFGGTESAAGAGAAKLQHLAMLPVCAGLVALLARAWMRALGLGSGPGRRRTARWAGVAFAALPVVAILAAWAFVDLFVTAYLLGFAYVGLRMLRFPRRGGGVLLGLMIAGGAGTKYTMIPLMAGLTGAWALCMLMRDGGLARAARGFALAGAVGALLGGVWLMRNAAWTGNPVYPLAWSVFGGGEWSAQNAAFYMAKAGEKGWSLPAGEGWPAPARKLAELIATPWSTYTRFENFEQHYSGPLAWLGWLALAAGVAGGVARLARRRGEGATSQQRAVRLWLGCVLVLSWAFWFATYQSTRMLLPTLGLVLAGGAAAVAAAWPGLGLIGRGAVRVTFGAALAATLIFYASQMLLPWGPVGKADAVAVGYGFQDPQLYLARRVPYVTAAQALSRATQPGETALLIGEHRTLYFDMPLLASDWFDTPQPLDLIRATRSNDELFARLAERRVRSVLINFGEMRLFVRDFLMPRMTPAEWARFEALLGDPRLRLVYENVQSNAIPPVDLKVYRID